MAKSIADRLRDAPHLDHSFLSPNGRMSSRARAAEMERVFGGENKITMEELRAAHLASIQPTEIEKLETEARRCRDHAAHGMRPRANIKQAEWCEARIAELKAMA